MEDKIIDSFGDATNIEQGLKKSLTKNTSLYYKAKLIFYGAACFFSSSPVFSSQLQRTCRSIMIGTQSLYVFLEIRLIISLIMGDYEYAELSSAIALTGCNGAYFGIFILMYATIYHKKVVEWGYFQNEHRQEEIQRLIGTNEFHTMILGLYCLCNMCYVLILVGHIVVGLWVAPSAQHLSDPEWQFMPHPFNIETETDFICVSVVLWIPMYVLLHTGLFDAIFTTTLAQEYYLAMAILWARIDQFSEEMENAFEKLNEKYLRTDSVGYIEESDYRLQLQAECKRAIKNIKLAVRAFQKQSERIRALCPYMEIKFLCAIIVIIYVCFAAVTSMYSDAYPMVQKFKILLILLNLYIVWFLFCYPGKIFNDMGDTMNQKVDNIPWYYLDPASRQDYYIFVCMAQRPMVFRAAGLIEAGMPTFIRLLKSTYTYFNFLRLNLQ